MATEQGFHKLKNPAHFDSIKKNGFRHSTPPEKHWLGSGIYFFLNPNGLTWAKRWPINDSLHKEKRANSFKGIIVATINTEDSFDLRDEEQYLEYCELYAMCLERFIDDKNRNIFKKGYYDGAVIGLLFNLDLLNTGETKVIIANFDYKFNSYRMDNSAIVLKDNMFIGEWSPSTQIQACVIDENVIEGLKLYDI